MNDTQLLDEIQVKDKTLTGIVDYVTPMYVTFYDISMDTDPTIIKIILIWRLYYSHMRFSVFKELYFQRMEFPAPNLINRKKVTSWGAKGAVKVSKPNRTSKRITKK